MTLLIATVAPGFAMLTQDTAWALASAAAPDAMPGEPGGELVHPSFHAAKIWVSQGIDAAIGGAGCVSTHVCFSHGLVEAGVRTIEAIVERAPRLLKAAWSGAAGPYMAIAIGYSRAEASVVGFALASGSGFEPVRMMPGSGHAAAPAPAGDDRAYCELAGMWTAAAHGHGTLPFQLAYADNVARAAAAGRYPRGMVIGGFAQTVTVTEDGVRDHWHALPGAPPAELQTALGPRRVRIGPDGSLEFLDRGVVMLHEPRETVH